MGKRRTPEPEVGLKLARNVVLHGDAANLFGEIVVENAGSEPVRLRRVVVRAGDAMCSALVVGRVPPGQTVTVPVNLPIDAAWPPGTHEAEVEIAGARGAATIVVAPRTDVRVFPATIEVTSPTGQETRRTVIATNQGNVAATLPKRVAVGLGQFSSLTAAIHHGLRTAGTEGFSRVADVATATLAEAEVSPALLFFETNALVLEPGESRAIEVRVQLPRGLRPGIRYTGSARVAGAGLKLIIDANGTAPEQDAAATEIR